MLIVVGSARARAGRREDLLATARAVVEATRSDVGCRSYGFFTDVTDDDAVLSLEIWEDRAALDAHMTHEHTREFLARVPELVQGEPAMAFYEVPPIRLADPAQPSAIAPAADAAGGAGPHVSGEQPSSGRGEAP